MTAFLDTNIIIRHLVGDSPPMAERALAFFRSEESLLLSDVIVAETVYVLQSVYSLSRADVATAIQSLLALDSVVCVDRSLLLRAIEVYQFDRIDFAEAYLVACAESTGITQIASFDRSIDRVPTITRIEPGATS